jgi:hypothetical protein
MPKPIKNLSHTFKRRSKIVAVTLTADGIKNTVEYRKVIETSGNPASNGIPKGIPLIAVIKENTITTILHRTGNPIAKNTKYTTTKFKIQEHV